MISAVGKGGHDIGLDRVGDLMGAREADLRVKLDVELDEGGDAGRAGAQIVQVAHRLVAPARWT